MNKKYITLLFLTVSSFVHGSSSEAESEADRHAKRSTRNQYEQSFMWFLIDQASDGVEFCKKQAKLYGEKRNANDEKVAWLVSTCYDAMIKGFDAEYKRLFEEGVVLSECYKNSYGFYTETGSLWPRRCPKQSEGNI